MRYYEYTSKIHILSKMAIIKLVSLLILLSIISMSLLSYNINRLHSSTPDELKKHTTDMHVDITLLTLSIIFTIIFVIFMVYIRYYSKTSDVYVKYMIYIYGILTITVVAILRNSIEGINVWNSIDNTQYNTQYSLRYIAPKNQYIVFLCIGIIVAIYLIYILYTYRKNFKNMIGNNS
jgi:hypothetical protein